MGYTRTDNNERLEKFKTYEFVSERNYELFEEFIRYLQADNNVGEKRVYKYITGFKTLFRKFIDVNLDEAEKDDFRRIIARIQSSDEYSAWTKHDFKVYIKKYYRTKHEHEFDRSDRVKKILDANFMKRNGEPENEKDTEALTPSEVTDMMEEANLVRDEFMVLFFFETGARISEILGNEKEEPLNIGDLTMKERYLEADFTTLKNDKGDRELALNRCMELLQRWLERHPNGEDQDAPLFVNLNKGRGNVMSKRYVAKLLRRLAEEAGINKRVTPHVFRHSAATYYATEKGWGTAQLKYWFGWKEAEEADRYCKENQERLKRKKLSQDGIEVESEDVDDLEPVECGKCGATWSPTQTYCGECGWSLDKETARQQKEVKQAGEQVVKAKMGDLTQDEVQEKKKQVLSKMEEMQEEFEELSKL